jgi:hypothetical protein
MLITIEVISALSDSIKQLRNCTVKDFAKYNVFAKFAKYDVFAKCAKYDIFAKMCKI